MKVVAQSRSLQGTRASRRLRRAGKVPAVIYGGTGEAKSIEIDHNALYHAMRVEAFHSSILDLEVDGTVESVLLRDAQWHPYKRQVLHADFQRVRTDQSVTLAVPLHFVNQEESPAIKQTSAIISHVLTEVTVTCLPKDLPEYIEVDMIEMTVEKAVHISDLVVPAGVEIHVLEDTDPVVATATVKGGGADEEDEAAVAPAADAAADDADKSDDSKE